MKLYRLVYIDEDLFDNITDWKESIDDLRDDFEKFKKAMLSVTQNYYDIEMKIYIEILDAIKYLNEMNADGEIYAIATEPYMTGRVLFDIDNNLRWINEIYTLDEVKKEFENDSRNE